MKIIVPRNRIRIAEEYIIRLDKMSDDAKSELDAATRRWYRATRTQETDMIRRVSSEHPDFEDEDDDDYDENHDDDCECDECRNNCESDEDDTPTLSLPSARLVVGVKLDDSQLYRLEMRGLKHHCPQTHIHPPQTEGLYCMWCGKPMAVDTVQVTLFDQSTLEPSPAMLAKTEIVSYQKTPTYSVPFGRLDVVWGRDKDGDLFAVVGKLINVSDDALMMDCEVSPTPAYTEAIKEVLMQFLTPKGLWHGANFGVWLFTLH